MLTLTNREAELIIKTLQRISNESRKVSTSHKVENLCNKVSFTIKKARRRNGLRMADHRGQSAQQV